jgi:hypothetical protein
MEAIYAYLMLEGFKGKELQQNGLVLAEIDALLASNDYTTLFNNDSMFSKTALQNLYTEGKRTALGGRFGGRSVTYPYGYSLVRQGSSEDNDGFKQPTRNLKLADYNRKAAQVNEQVLNLARTGELTPEFQQTLIEGMDSSMSGSTTTEIPEVPDTSEVLIETPETPPVIADDTPIEIDDAVKIMNGSSLSTDVFREIIAPTEEEQIAISLKAWNLNQDPNKMWPYEGPITFSLQPSRHDASMQPTNTVVISETSEQGGAVSVDAFMGGIDDLMDDTPAEIAVVNANANQPFFLTPEIQFGFKMGEPAYFRVVGGPAADTYEDLQFPVTLTTSNEPALVTNVKVAWAKPSGDFKSTDTITNFQIELEQAGEKSILTLDSDGKLLAVSSNSEFPEMGVKYNKSQVAGTYNLYGGMMEHIESDEAVIYAHGGLGFSGLPNKTDGEPIDTMVWEDLNSSTAGLTGTVKVNAATDVPAVIRTQMSRFYGNETISDPRLNWKSWGDDPESVLTPILGGNNVIFNFNPQPKDISVDVKAYVDYHPEYLAPKLLNLTLTPVKEGEIPEETETTGVISPTIKLDDDGEIEDAVWSQVLDFTVTGGEASEYFGSSQKKTFVLPGDEQHLVFKDINNNEVNVGKGQILYITYDKPSSIRVDGTLVARGVRLYCEGGVMIDIPTTQDTGNIWLEDPNGKSVGGTIKGGELSPPAPEIAILNETATDAWNNRRSARRRAKQSDRFTNRDESGAVVTRSIAFKSSPNTKEYFVLAETSEGFKIMKIDLDIRRD